MPDGLNFEQEKNVYQLDALLLCDVSFSIFIVGPD